MSKNEREKKQALLQLIQSCIQQDQALREEYHIGDKFRFIRERLKALEVEIQTAINEMETEAAKQKTAVTTEEAIVFVYLYNAQGLTFPTWQKMVNPSVFYEYSVNRPIYTEQAFIDAFIRSKSNKAQHGYLTFAIKQSEIIPPDPSAKTAQDMIGNPLIKIREGSLKLERLISFTHQDVKYTVNESGQMVKKEGA